MKKWKNWLLPLFTCLVVLCAALLPQRLSELRDRTLLGTVHTEKLTDDWLLARPLSLTERMELLSLWSWEPEKFTVVTQDLSFKMTPEEIPALETQLWDELQSLAAAGILSQEMLPEEITRFSGTRTSVRLTEELRGATFLQMEVTDKWKGVVLTLVLDADSGHAIALQVFFPTTGPSTANAAEMGRAFLDRLGVENELQTDGAAHAVFLLPETNVLYDVDWDVFDGGGVLTIQPEDPPSSMVGNSAAVYDAPG